MNKKLNELRKEIDTIDNRIIGLLSTRISLVKEIAKIKKKNNMEILDKNREENLQKERKELARKLKISENLIEKIFEEILKNSISIQKEVKNEKR